jgi:transposase
VCEPTTGACTRPADGDGYCDRCDLLVGLDGLHVVAVAAAGRALTVTVESAARLAGCPACGVVAHSHGRREVTLVDAPCFGRPVRVVWRKRTWRCADPDCPKGSFSETDAAVAGRRALLTTRACWWAIGQMRREHASVLGLARQLAHDMEHGVAVDPSAARGDGRRQLPLRRRRPARGRRAHLAITSPRSRRLRADGARTS